MEPPQARTGRKWKSFLKALFLTKFSTNLLVFMVVVAISLATFSWITDDDPAITGSVILEQNLTCPEQSCPLCNQQECVQNCELCPVKSQIKEVEVVKFKCADGKTVDDLDDCKDNFPNINVDDSGTVNGITISIDDVDWEKDDNDSGFVTKVYYTIINRGDLPIVPKVQIKVYETWNLKVKKQPSNKIIDLEEVIAPDSYLQREDKARIYFRGDTQTIRFLLIDSLPDPDQEIIAVVKEFKK